MRLHFVTIPSRSTPKMDVFAVSMSCDRSSATRSCSLVISRISVRSCPTPMTPMTSPFGPRLVVAFSRISLRCPNFVKRENSKFAVSLPMSAAASLLFTEF